MFSSIGQFPEMAPEPVPFYKHPYKLFAVTPITLFFLKTMQILHDEGQARPDGICALGYVITYVHNLSCLVLGSMYGRRTPYQLPNAVLAMNIILGINFLDACFPAVHNEWFGEYALIVRVALTAYWILLSLDVVRYANQDQSYLKIRRIECEEVNVD